MAEAKTRSAARLRKRYCAALRKELASVPQLRRRALQDMRRSLDEYLEQNPAATWADLEGEFGSPRQAADHILNSLDAEQIKREARHFRWRRVAAFAIVGLGLAYALFLCGRLAINHLMTPDYVVIGPAVEMEGPIPTSPPYPEEAPLIW